MRRTLAAAALAAVALLAASCGDDDESTSSTDDTVKVASAADESTSSTDDTVEVAETAETADDAGSDSEPDEPAATDADDDAGADDSEDASGDENLSAECLALKAEMEDRFSNDSDFGEIAEAIDSIRDFTPADLDDDADVLSGVYQEMADIIEENGGDLAIAMQKPDVIAKLESMNSPEVQEATANITAYFEERCPTIVS